MESYLQIQVQSLPRGNSKHSYLIFIDKELILKDVDGNIIKQMELPPRL